LNISDIKLICGAQRLPCGDRIDKKNIAHWLAAHPKKKRGHPKLKKVVATATTDDANNTHTHPKTGAMGNHHINAQEGGARKLHFWDFLGISSEYLVSKQRAKMVHASK
jgi:hypothetical protein